MHRPINHELKQYIDSNKRINKGGNLIDKGLSIVAMAKPLLPAACVVVVRRRYRFVKVATRPILAEPRYHGLTVGTPALYCQLSPYFAPSCVCVCVWSHLISLSLFLTVTSLCTHHWQANCTDLSV